MPHQANVYLPDLIRHATVLMLLIVLVIFPKSIGIIHQPSRRGWVFIIGLGLMFVGQIGLTVSRIGHPLLLFGSPITLVGSIMLIIYCIDVIRRGG